MPNSGKRLSPSRRPPAPKRWVSTPAASATFSTNHPAPSGASPPSVERSGASSTRSNTPSGAAVHDDEVGRDADHEPDDEEPEPELAVAEAPHPVPHLADHVEDRAAREGVERELERLRRHVVADDRSDERGAATDQSGEREPSPRGAHVAERADDAEALGRVVEGEPDDQHGGQADRPGAGGDPDREPLREVVQADGGGDGHAGAH